MRNGRFFMATESPLAAASAAQYDPTNPLHHAIELYNQGRMQESEAAFTPLLTSPDRAAVAAYWIGLIRLEAGDLTGASTMFQQDLARNPQDANAYAALGSIAERLNRLDDARSYYGWALAINPGLTSTRERLTALTQAASGTAPQRRGPAGRMGNVLILVLFLGWSIFGFLSLGLSRLFVGFVVILAVLTLLAARAFISLFPVRQQ